MLWTEFATHFKMGTTVLRIQSKASRIVALGLMTTPRKMFRELRKMFITIGSPKSTRGKVSVSRTGRATQRCRLSPVVALRCWLVPWPPMEEVAADGGVLAAR